MNGHATYALRGFLISIQANLALVGFNSVTSGTTNFHEYWYEDHEYWYEDYEYQYEEINIGIGEISSTTNSYSTN